MNKNIDIAFLDGVLSGLCIEHKDEKGVWFGAYKVMGNIASEWHCLSDESQRVISKAILGDEQ